MISVSAYTVLFPDDSTFDLQSIEGIDVLEFWGSNQSDYFNASGANYSLYSVSTGNDTVLGSQFSNESPSGEITFGHYWDSLSSNGEQGLEIDYRSGQLIFETNDGTTTAKNLGFIDGELGKDIISGSGVGERIYVKGGRDVI